MLYSPLLGYPSKETNNNRRERKKVQHTIKKSKIKKRFPVEIYREDPRSPLDVYGWDDDDDK